MKATLFAIGLLCFSAGGVTGSMIASPKHTDRVGEARASLTGDLDNCIKVVQKTKVDLITCVKVTNNLVDLTNQFMSDLWRMPIEDLAALRQTPQPPPLPKLESYE